MKKLITIVMLVLTPAMVIAQDSTTGHRSLLDKVKEQRSAEQARSKERETRFLAEKDQQQSMLRDAKAEFERYQRENNPLKQLTEQNAQRIAELEEAISLRKSEIGDLDSIFRQMSGDFAAALNQSPTSMQLPERHLELANLSSKSVTASLDAMESLWLLVQEDMTLSGEVTRYHAPVVALDGQISDETVIRFGAFSTYTQAGEFLRYIPETKELLINNVPGSIAQQNQQFFSSIDTISTLVLDPSNGTLLSVLSHSPSWRDRIDDGGIIGRIILTLGAIGLLIVLWRTAYLSWQMSKLNKQLHSLDTPSNDNALGRILLHVGQLKNVDLHHDVVQLKLDEAVINEVNGLERSHDLLKLMAATAPLLGLLGTVTGMIITFQSISLFGSGDPKLMAGGISQALVTTVLGLVVAIPLLFGHSLVSSLADKIFKSIDEQSAGMLARLIESKTELQSTEGATS